MFNILGRRYLFFGFSLLLILPGLLIAIFGGLNLSVDFTGGTLVEISFESGSTPPPEEIVEIYNQFGVSDVQVQTTGDNTIIARSSFLEDDTRAIILTTIEEQFNDPVTIIRIDSVGATIGQEVTLRAALAVAVAAISFGMVHLLNLLTGREPVWVVGQVVWASILGLFYGVVVIESGSLWPAMLVHYLSNVFVGSLTSYLQASASTNVQAVYGIVFSFGIVPTTLMCIWVFVFTTIWPIVP